MAFLGLESGEKTTISFLKCNSLHNMNNNNYEYKCSGNKRVRILFFFKGNQKAVCENV